MDKQRIFLVGSFLILLVLVGCSFNLQEMNLPFVPTSTATLVPTPLPTATPTLVPKTSKTDGVIQTEVTADGQTKLTDLELGFSAVFPAQWLVLGLDSDVIAQLETVFPDEIPVDLSSAVQTFASVPGMRAVALDYANSFSDIEEVNTNIIFVYQAAPEVAEMEFDQMVDDAVEAMPTEVPNSDVIYQVVDANSNGVEYGKVIITHPRETFGLPMRQVMVFIKIGDGVLTITGTALDEEYTRMETSFQRMIDSIEISN